MPLSKSTGNDMLLLFLVLLLFLIIGASHVALVVKDPLASAGGVSERHRFNPWVGRISQRRTWQPTPVFFPRESHGQRSLVGYGP